MRRPLRTQLLKAACCAAVAALAPMANAAIVPVTSGVTTFQPIPLFDQVNGITVPSGKTFSSLSQAAHAQADSASGQTSAAAVGWGGFGPNGPLPGTGENLRLNRMIIGNGYGFIDLTRWDGFKWFTATDADGAHQDFLLMDHLGNDDFAISAIMEDGSIGARVDFRASDFGQQPGVDVNLGNPFPAGMVAFDVSDLRAPNGLPLAPDAVLQGLRIYENTTVPPNNRPFKLDLIMVVGDLTGIAPEPSTAMLAMVGLLGAAGARRRG